MIIYFAGSLVFDMHKWTKLNMLESYFYLSKGDKLRIKEIVSEAENFFLDSGAFSAWSKGVQINIDEYIRFIQDSGITNYAVLDVIGNPEKTLDNQKYMESKGLRPIPCFHYGEDFKYLHYYCANYDYVALGGMVPIETRELRGWLDSIFTKYPNHKFHGFGLTTFTLLDRYNWFSVDSTSYLSGGKVSSIIIKGKMFMITDNDNSELNLITRDLRQEFDFMCGKYGFDEESLKNTKYDGLPMHKKGYFLRILYNIYFFKEYSLKRNFKGMKVQQFQLTDFPEEPEAPIISTENMNQNQ